MSFNEAETRFYLIDPELRKKGYNDCRSTSEIIENISVQGKIVAESLASLKR